ncbi:hypothetical protein [Enterococcus rotai]|uniref:Nmad2 family putative nucleotide modification protein n=1 Tax=Enterococcus rotai TaxID=118060 RepID=UPI0032B4EF13
MKLSHYIVKRDYGFAPNPFYGVCTLATCKSKLRKRAEVGDWVVGIGSASSLYKGKIICAMQVDEILTFDQYWNDDRFQMKKPVMNGSLQQKYGDNIYYTDEDGKIEQLDSHHSYVNGEPNMHNLNRDTGGEKVLISNKFWYFGKNAVKLPSNLERLANVRMNYKNINENEDKAFIDEFVNWIQQFDNNQLIGYPEKFISGFERYDGIS